MDAIKAYERNRALILAAENWAVGYKNDPENYGKLLKTEARLQRKLLRLFKDQSQNVDKIVNWYAYRQTVEAAIIDVIVNDDEISKVNGLFVNVAFDEIALATALGAQASELQYKVPLGLSSFDDIIQHQALTQVAKLVGKRVDKDGQMIDNPKAEYRISDKMRSDVRQSIQTSLAKGEDLDTARTRVMDTIKNPQRAEVIAQTEVVNAYDGGIQVFGEQTNAVGKQWLDNDAVDICADFADIGPVVFDYLYDDQFEGPAAHPRCRCRRRLIYQSELDQNPDMELAG